MTTAFARRTRLDACTFASALVAMLVACGPARTSRAPASSERCETSLAARPAAAKDGGGPGAPAPPPASHPTLAPFTAHGIVWSPRGDLVATNELSTCGMPSGEPCEDHGELVVVDARTGTERARRAPAPIFGFRADGEWLVVGTASGGIAEWSVRSGETRASAFDALAAGAKALCLAPDDRHALVLTCDGDLALRARDAAGRAHEDETALYGPMDEVPTECAFAPDGSKVAVAYPEGVAVHVLRDDPQVAPYVTLPFPRASHLAWSTDGRELVVTGQLALQELTQSKQRLVAQWRLDGGPIHAVLAASPGALARGALWAHDGCGWQRAAPGAPLRLVGPPNPDGSCARDVTVDVVRSPDGHFVAAASGRYGGRTLRVAPVP